MAKDHDIRRAGEGDIIGIVYVQATSWIKHYADPAQGINENDVRTVDFNSKTSEWQHILRSPSYRVWVAARGRIILAFLATRRDKDFGEIYEQHTLDENQRRGLGTELFVEAKKWLGELPILLRIPIYAPGVEFYKKLSFSIFEEGEVDFIRLPSGKQITTVVMRRQAQPDKQPKQSQPASQPAVAEGRLFGRAKLAQASGLRSSTIKFYTEIGILPFEQEDQRLARRYNPNVALSRLKEIKRLRGQGLSIAQIKQRLS